MGVEHTGKYLAFDLGGQCYAIEVSRVEVVLETTPITRVPKAAEHLRGVINYRGAVIPVLDLGVRFGIGLSPSGPGTSIIVLSIRYGHEDITIGVLAQGVREVIDLDAARIERPPQLGARAEDEFVAGIGERGGEFIVLLDIDKAFRTEGAPGERTAETQ
jgi:purine-binding chemotaxis protein CheW